MILPIMMKPQLQVDSWSVFPPVKMKLLVMEFNFNRALKYAGFIKLLKVIEVMEILLPMKYATLRRTLFKRACIGLFNQQNECVYIKIV